MLSGDVCCRVPYPPGRRSAFYRFSVSLSFIVLSLSLSKHRTFFGSIIFFFVERYIESFGRISNTNNTSRSWYKYVVHAFRVLVYCKHEHVRNCFSLGFQSFPQPCFDCLRLRKVRVGHHEASEPGTASGRKFRWILLRETAAGVPSVASLTYTSPFLRPAIRRVRAGVCPRSMQCVLIARRSRPAHCLLTWSPRLLAVDQV